MSKMEEMQSYFDEYPEALRKARASSSLTLAELARISGVPYNSICSVNSGATKQPLLYYSAATCKALGLSLDELFGMTNTEGSVTQLKRINALEVKVACLGKDIEYHKRMNAVYRPLVFCLVGVCAILLCATIGYVIFDIQLKNTGLFKSGGLTVLAVFLAIVALAAVALIAFAIKTVAHDARIIKRQKDKEE